MCRSHRQPASLILLTAMMLGGCGKTVKTVTETETAAETAAETATETATETADLCYPVPDGSAADLIAFMNEMAEEPQGDDDNAQTRDLQERMESRVRAATRLMEVTNDRENNYFAAVAKLESLKTLQAIGVEGATARLDAYLELMATNKDERLARLGQMARLESEFIRAVTGDAADTKRLTSNIRQLLRDTADPQLVFPAQQIGKQLEFRGFVDAAKDIYDLVGQAVEKIHDEQTRQDLQRYVANGLKRVSLVGQPLELTGKQLDGEAFNWDQLAGQVVLVDFWATWCDPCIYEFANIRRNYNRYHDHGFEVIGMNLDESADRLGAFLSKENLPWPVIVGDAPEDVGFANSNAVRCGVDAIPFLVLVGRDGNVSDIHLRGEELGKRLAELFPEVDANAVDQTPADEMTRADFDEVEMDGDVELDEDVELD